MPSAIFTRRFAANYFSTLGFIGLSYWVISDLSGFHRGMLQGQWQFGMFEIDAVAHHPHAVAVADRAVRRGADSFLRALSVAALQGVRVPAGTVIQPAAPAQAAIAARGARCWHDSPGACRCRRDCRPAAKQAGLALLLKFFFAPLMINWCLNHAGGHGELRRAVHRRPARRRRPAANCSTPRCSGPASSSSSSSTRCCSRSGYIIEVPGARQSHPLAWIPPSSAGSSASPAIRRSTISPAASSNGRAATSRTSTTPRSTIIANIALLISLGIYSWASVALGFKASNLTNRGIVSHGPYAYVRHPGLCREEPRLVDRRAAHALSRVRQWRRAASPGTRCSPCAAGPPSTRCAPSPRNDTCCSRTTATRSTWRSVKWRFIPRVI